jgi:hypothetical protein
VKTNKKNLLSHQTERILKKASQNMNRRDFMKVSAIGLMGTQMMLEGCASFQPKTTRVPKRIRKGNLYYRRLGRTDMVVSEISLGGSPVPPEPVFRKAIEMGVNYFDTSAFYSNGNSERKIGKIIKGRRDSFYVTTKFRPFKNRNKKADLMKGV